MSGKHRRGAAAGGGQHFASQDALDDELPVDRAAQRAAVAVAVTAFFMVTLDAVVVNVALPSIRGSLGGGVQGLQWVVDGYTLTFAALLLSAGAFADRTGAQRAMKRGLVLFTLASLGCALAPTLLWLVLARFVQGAAGAVMMPASLALIGQAQPDPVRRARAVASWALGAAVASTSGPVIGGLLSLIDWRLIFVLNLPVGIAAIVVIKRARRSVRRPAPFDLVGQLAAAAAMAGLTFAIIEAGAVGLTAPRVVAAFILAVVASAAFFASQARGAHPMVPRGLFRSRTVSVAIVVGFSFMVGFYGLPFLFSLYFQQQRGLSSLGTGLAFAPMMLIGLLLTPVSSRIVERVGTRFTIASGLVLMAGAIVALAIMPFATPLWLLSATMLLVGVGGPLVMPPLTAVLLNSVPTEVAGTTGGIFNTARQVGGALAIAVFGALVADTAHFMHGLRTALVLAAVVLVIAACASWMLPRSGPAATA